MNVIKFGLTFLYNLPRWDITVDVLTLNEQNCFRKRNTNSNENITFRQTRILGRQPHIMKSQSFTDLNVNSNVNNSRSNMENDQGPTKKDQEQIVDKKKKRKFFVPTVPEPFEMTVREERKMKERALANEYLNHSKSDKPQPVTDTKQFRAIDMPSHVKEKRYEKLIKKSYLKITSPGAG